MGVTSSTQCDKIGGDAPSKGRYDARHVSSFLDYVVYGQLGHRVTENTAFEISVQNNSVDRYHEHIV